MKKYIQIYLVSFLDLNILWVCVYILFFLPTLTLVFRYPNKKGKRIDQLFWHLIGRSPARSIFYKALFNSGCVANKVKLSMAFWSRSTICL